ncbi:Protein-lysine N-methyltransferase EFM1 [Paramyrothecium foliicola]|nr:Protein-lysine N-methyltransferase EFM1 [Paramyrothecium foliicola]
MNSSDMSIEKKYERLIEWARENGTFVHPSLRYVQTPDSGVEAIIDPNGTALKPSETFARISSDISLSYLNAVNAGKPGSCYRSHSEPLPATFLINCVDHDMVNSIFLAQQYLLGDDSFWSPYIRILPQPYDESNPGIPLLWDDDDILWLKGTHLEKEVPKKRKELKARWRKAMDIFQEAGGDTTPYTWELCLWAYYIFVARSFPAIALEGDLDNIKEEYQILVKSGVNLDDVPKILMPIFDSLNHAQNTPLEYTFEPSGLGLAKVPAMAPGDRLLISYDKDTQRFNNTFCKIACPLFAIEYCINPPKVLRDFGFIIEDTEVPELVLPFPLDVTIPRHPSHVVFSTASTVNEFYASAEETFFSWVTVRAPLRHPHGLMNPMHPTPALRYFHPTLVSMVSFEVASLVERAKLRTSPNEIPSDRNKAATIAYLQRHLEGFKSALVEAQDHLGAPKNSRQSQAQAYRKEQLEVLSDVLSRMNPVD